VVIEDAAKDWEALRVWDFNFFAARLGSAQVLVNDRAPARLQDISAGSPQQTVSCSISDFVAYCLDRER
jgi:hypothetical protein